jgi:hypothetical protein
MLSRSSGWLIQQQHVGRLLTSAWASATRFLCHHPKVRRPIAAVEMKPVQRFFYLLFPVPSVRPIRFQ